MRQEVILPYASINVFSRGKAVETRLMKGKSNTQDTRSRSGRQSFRGTHGNE